MNRLSEHWDTKSLLYTCHERSIALLKRNLTEGGILAATPGDRAEQRGYTAIFGRDAAVCALGMAVSGDKLLERAAVTGLHTLIAVLRAETLWTFIVLQSATMSCFGLIMANFGAMAMESMGSVAGIAASLQGCTGTAGGALVAALIGLQFNGSTVPLALGALLCGLVALGFVLLAEGGRLFRAHLFVPGDPSPATPGIH